MSRALQHTKMTFGTELSIKDLVQFSNALCASACRPPTAEYSKSTLMTDVLKTVASPSTRLGAGCLVVKKAIYVINGFVFKKILAS